TAAEQGPGQPEYATVIRRFPPLWQALACGLGRCERRTIQFAWPATAAGSPAGTVSATDPGGTERIAAGVAATADSAARAIGHRTGSGKRQTATPSAGAATSRTGCRIAGLRAHAGLAAKRGRARGAAADTGAKARRPRRQSGAVGRAAPRIGSAAAAAATGFGGLAAATPADRATPSSASRPRRPLCLAGRPAAQPLVGPARVRAGATGRATADLSGRLPPVAGAG